MLEIIKTPAADIGTTGFTSRWLATDAPIEFWAQRKDNTIGSTADNGGKLQINLSSSNVNFYLQVGESIYLHSTSGSFVSASVFSKQSDQQYTLTTPYSATAFDFYVAFQKSVNYFVDVKLTVNGVEQSYLADFTPDAYGLALCDVSGYLQSYVNDEKQTNSGQANVKELNQSGKFTFLIRENYIGNTSTGFVQEPHTWYFIKGTRSIEKGSNVSEFVPNLSAECQFLNYFESPTCYHGLPFDISFIYSELLAGKAVQVIEEHYNSSNDMISTKTINLDATQIEGVNSLLINTETLELNCKYMKLKMGTDNAQPPVVVNTWYITESPFSPSNPLKFVKDGNSVKVSTSSRKAVSILPVLNLPDPVLTPVANRQATYTGTQQITQASINQNANAQWYVSPQLETTTQLGIDGTLKLTLIALLAGTNHGYISTREVAISSSIATREAYKVKLKEVAEACAADINAQAGLSIPLVTVADSDLNPTTEIKIDGSVYSAPIIGMLSSSNRMSFGLDARRPVSSAIMSNTLTFSESQDLFAITVDGKIKNGWRFRSFGFSSAFSRFKDDYEFTYSLV